MGHDPSDASRVLLPDGRLTLAGAGLIFAKFSRPRALGLFSRMAVVSARDGVPRPLFRIANERGNEIAEARVRAVLARADRGPAAG